MKTSLIKEQLNDQSISGFNYHCSSCVNPTGRFALKTPTQRISCKKRNSVAVCGKTNYITTYIKKYCFVHVLYLLLQRGDIYIKKKKKKDLYPLGLYILKWLLMFLSKSEINTHTFIMRY